MVREVGDEEFADLIQNTAVVAKFYADWCGPCKTLGPIFEKVSSELSDVTFVSVNVEKASSATQKYGVRSVPTIVIFSEGAVKDMNTGIMDEQSLKSWIQKNVG